MKQTLQPTGWIAPRGYANGVAAQGVQVFIAGQIGWNAQAQFSSRDFGAQARQALLNVVAVLAEAGGRPEHLVRLTWYVVDKREYLAASKSVGDAFREVIGHYDIAMSAVQVAALLEDDARVEIEATAVLPAGTVGTAEAPGADRTPGAARR
jgi:enamine deaminase RidA (YjgF/YER057c/UK114 family)